jgi:DNA-binding transcriptional regulator LsrR (DeoR family)
MIQPGQVIGLTGSRTLTELVRHLGSFCNPKGLRVVQLMGSIGANISEHDAIELSRKGASTFDSMLYSLNSPVFVANSKIRQDFMDMDQVKTIWSLYREMDVAMVGIGRLKSSVFIDRGVLGEKDLAHLFAHGAIGETCGRFFDANGQECESDYRDRVISISLEELRRVPLVVGATVGAERAEAVVAAARSGLIKALIIDADGARAALEFANKHKLGKGMPA